jgi:predicted Rossmann fold nucleotide-binding protein DprA/Smf involved in DNA uptake
MFLSRNRLVVGASALVVVVEAGLRSGSVATGRMALELGRAVIVVPGSPGTDGLLERGARAARIDPRDPDGVAAALRGGLAGDIEPAEPAWPVALRAAARRLEPGRRWLSADDFADPAEGTAALVEAEALGEVVEVSPGRYVPAG